MIHYRPITGDMKAQYERILSQSGERGCEYSFANLFVWGRQRMAFLEDTVSVFSQFNRKSVYLFPIGTGDKKKTLDAIIHDASVRDIPCRITGMTKNDCEYLDSLYPGKFRFHTDRDSFDYLYSVEELAELTGRRFQRKRNHLNRFLQTYPNWEIEPISPENADVVRTMVENWYQEKLSHDPTMDFYMERSAIHKALRYQNELEMVGLILRVDGAIAAMTMGSPLSDHTFDVHFEKALECFDGAYPLINREFARYIRDTYPEITRLNREDDMGIEGLRKAKLSYNPTQFLEKYWACLLEDGYDY